MDRLVPEHETEGPEAFPTGGTDQEARSPREPVVPTRILPEVESGRDVGPSRRAPIHVQKKQHRIYHLFGHYEQGEEFLKWIQDAHREFQIRLKPNLLEMVGHFTCAVYIVSNDGEYRPDLSKPVDPEECGFCVFCDKPEQLDPIWIGRKMGRFPLIVDSGPVRLLADVTEKPNPANIAIYRPLVPGCSIGVQGEKEESASACCFLKDTLTKDHYMLTCGHLFEENPPVEQHELIVQPSEIDSDYHFDSELMRPLVKKSRKTPVGKKSHQHFERVLNAGPLQRYYDFALIKLTKTAPFKNFARKSKENQRMVRILDIELNSHSAPRDVFGISRSTGHRKGICKFTLQEGYLPNVKTGKSEYFEFQSQLCAKMSCQPGDSGGLIYTEEGAAVAMIWGGSAKHDIAYVAQVKEIVAQANSMFGMNLILANDRKSDKCCVS